MIKKIIAGVILAGVSFALPAVSASAAGFSPYAEVTAQPGQVTVTTHAAQWCTAYDITVDKQHRYVSPSVQHFAVQPGRHEVMIWGYCPTDGASDTQFIGDTFVMVPPVTHKAGTYRVRRGDTLWRIAVRSYGYLYPSNPEHAGHLWHTLADRNMTYGPRIHVGQVLEIPSL